MSELFSAAAESQRGTRAGGTIARRAVMTLFAAVMVLGLANVFGQRTDIQAADSPQATLRVEAPSTVRGGLFFQTRIDVITPLGISQPELLFDRGVLEGMQVSSVKPEATAETSHDGRLKLQYDRIEAGAVFTVWMQFQVDPTATGAHGYGIELRDGGKRIARVQRDLRVLP